MKKLIFLVVALSLSGFSFGAKWTYTTSGSLESFYIDRDFYKYDAKNNTVDVWTKSVKKKVYLDEFYTSSKALDRYSCADKKSKNLAFVEYDEQGGSLRSSTKPHGEFSLIFPDSIGEGIWSAACGTKGKGFKFTKSQLEIMPADDLSKMKKDLGL
jgi:hypothetical protein